MTDVWSPYTGYYGVFGPSAILYNTTGGLQPVPGSPSTTISVTQLDGTTPVTLYTDQYGTPMSTTGGNYNAIDANGNCTFWAEPGVYIINFQNVSIPTVPAITAQITPYFADSVWNVIKTDTGPSSSPMSGDVRCVDAAAASVIETLPTYTSNGTTVNPAGLRLKFLRVDGSTTNTVTIQVPSGGGTSPLIYGPGLSSSGSSELPLNYQSAYVELICDGTNWHVTGGAIDTGWQSVTGFVSGWGPISGSLSPYYRQIGSTVYFKGGVICYSDSAEPICTFSVGYPRPPKSTDILYFTCWQEEQTQARVVTVTNSGGATRLGANGATALGPNLYLNNIVYNVG